MATFLSLDRVEALCRGPGAAALRKVSELTDVMTGAEAGGAPCVADRRERARKPMW